MLSSRFMKAGLSLIAAAAASAMIATPAFAAATGTGVYSSWSKAQHAAGFGLRHPATTYGLKMDGKILVDQCVVTGHLTDKVVVAAYGKLTNKSLGLEQDNAGVPCGNGEEGTSLGRYKIGSVRGHLYGECGAVAPQYSCASTKIALWISWKKGKKYYVASSFDETRARLVHFARTLKKV